MGVPFRAHTASGALSEELKGLASMKMTEIVQHKPGYNSVIKHRARTDAKERNWTYIPFGMECQEAVIQTAAQVENIPDGVKRLVMPIGSGMSFCGVATGLMRFGKSIPLFGVRVGADYHRVFDRYFPPNFGPSLFSKGTVKTIMMSPHAYSKRVHAEVEGILLDPVYEAKCAQYLQKDDLLWIVGIR
jgi:1-aminocyclopropane-1-carboxylate deaminase/D-cysteine desulfhydrase-like pyridoxal-dependent ACC family enzyme